MAQDEFKAKGPTKASKPDAGGGNTREVPVFGIVKDNVDPTRSGRLKVYLGDKGGSDADNSDSWTTVSYMTTFFGKVLADAGNAGYGDYKNNPSSYGEWHAPPDIGTTVICIFINGDPNYGFYIGCVPEADALQMVPAIGSSDNIIANAGESESFGGAVRLPVTNINTNNKDIADSTDYINAARPVHSYTASIMNQQGIIRDPIRGPISSSAQREAASRVGWGVSTPGRPIYEGGYTDETVTTNLESPDKAQSLRVVARRGGHSLVMDDGDIIGRDQLIRIRTALGHQILMSDDGQTLMILHSNGQSYIELGKEGTIDMYSTNSVNIRTQGDLNLHADNNVNIHAAKDFNVKAKNFHVDTEEETSVRAGTNIKTYALTNITAKAGGALALSAGGDASMLAGGIAYVNGSKINLNTGEASTQPEEVSTIPVLAQTDTLYDEKKGFMAAPGKLLTIASRAPAHAPWANAGQGVDVKTDLSASSQLPSQPSAAVEAANTAGAETSPVPVSVATAASAPTVPAVSDAMDIGTTNAVLGSAATAAAGGVLSAAVTQGAAIVSTAAGNVAAIGAFAQSPENLMTSNVIKPGSATLIKGLVQSGANISQAMPASLFSGVPGAKNLTELISNPTAQAGSMVRNLQQAQTALGSVGALKGTEAPGQLAGLVTAASTVGLDATLGAVQQAAGGFANSSISSLTAGLTGGSIGNAISAIGAGSAAAGIATTVTGGMGGIAGALTAMGKTPSLTGLLDAAKGVSGSAFNAIKNSFTALTPGVPQNLTAIAKVKASASAAVADQTSQLDTSLINDVTGAGSDALGSLTSVAGGSLTSVNGVLGAANNSISGITGAATALVNAVNSSASKLDVTGVGRSLLAASGAGSALSAITNISALGGAGATIGNGGLAGLSSAASVIQQGAAAATSSALASGMNNLPGGIKIAGAVMNNALGAINAIPGADKLTGLMKDAQSAAMNGLKLPEIPDGLNSLESLALSGLPAGAAAEMKSAMAALSSGTGGSIKLPTFGFNTVDRSGITSQISDVLGDPGIPPPNLVGEISSQAKDAIQQLRDSSLETLAVIDELDAWDDRINAAKEAFYIAESSMPQGDPSIDAAREAWFALIDAPERMALTDKLDTLAGTDEIPLPDTSATAAADFASTSEQSIMGLITDGAASSSGMLGIIEGAAGAGLSSVTGTLSSITGSLTGGSSLLNSITSSVGSPLTNLTTLASTAVGAAAGQGASAVKALQASAKIASRNNSIAGILGTGIGGLG